MPLLECEDGPALAVPQPGRAVAAGRDDLLPVGRERGAQDRVALAVGGPRLEDPHFLVALQIPNLDLLVVSARDQPAILVLGRRA